MRELLFSMVGEYGSKESDRLSKLKVA